MIEYIFVLISLIIPKKRENSVPLSVVIFKNLSKIIKRIIKLSLVLKANNGFFTDKINISRIQIEKNVKFTCEGVLDKNNDVQSLKIKSLV